MTEALSLPEVENAGVPDQASEGHRPPTRAELLEGLNDPQRAAVMHAGAPLQWSVQLPPVQFVIVHD